MVFFEGSDLVSIPPKKKATGKTRHRGFKRKTLKLQVTNLTLGVSGKNGGVGFVDPKSKKSIGLKGFWVE